MHKTYQPKSKDIERSWHLVDVKGKVLGRVATEIAKYLMGKHKPTYSPHMDSGDYVVVINASKVKLTGKKSLKKVYRHHSGYPGGFKSVSFSKIIDEHPERAIMYAVSGMLPDNRLKKDRLARLKVFAGGSHKYEDKFKSADLDGGKVA
jgi:large subunit ribosomal protein L13